MEELATSGEEMLNQLQKRKSEETSQDKETDVTQGIRSTVKEQKEQGSRQS